MYETMKRIIYSANQAILQTRRRLCCLAVGAALLVAGIVSFYVWNAITHSRGLPYDLDGWGHLIAKMQASGETWRLLPQAFHPERGFAVPFLFGVTYCLLGIPESVQIFNILLQSISAVLLVGFFGKYLKNPLLGACIALSWAVWPPTRYVYGYYMAEPLLGLICLLMWGSAVILLHQPKKHVAAFYGMLLAFALYVKSSTLLTVFLLLLFLSGLFYRMRHYAVLAALWLAFVLAYSIWPLYSYITYQRVLPMTINGGFVLHMGTYLPGDDMSARYLRTLPEYWAIEANAPQEPVERDAYFRKLAIEQITREPIKQFLLLIKKILRFWFYIPRAHWLPTPKTFIVMTPLLLLAAIGAFSNRSEHLAQAAGIIILAMWALHSAIHSEFRYNFPVLPMLFYLAFCGGDFLCRPLCHHGERR